MFGAFQFSEPYFGEGPGEVEQVLGPTEIDLAGAVHGDIELEGSAHEPIDLAGGGGTIRLEGARH